MKLLSYEEQRNDKINHIRSIEQSLHETLDGLCVKERNALLRNRFISAIISLVKGNMARSMKTTLAAKDMLVEAIKIHEEYRELLSIQRDLDLEREQDA